MYMLYVSNSVVFTDTIQTMGWASMLILDRDKCLPECKLPTGSIGGEEFPWPRRRRRNGRHRHRRRSRRRRS